LKVIICGGRNYQLNDDDYDVINKLHKEYSFSCIVSGHATGADRCGEVWALDNGVEIRTFPANWKKYGKAAGPMRNKQMAEFAEALIAFPGGYGTVNMINQAITKKLKMLFIAK